MKPTDEFLENLAKDYVTEVHARVGSTSYIYEDWDDPSDDATATSVEQSTPRSDQTYIASHRVVDTTIVSSKLISRDDEAKEYTVEVNTSVVIQYSEDEDDDLCPEQIRIISCYIGYEGEYFVSDAEE
ncbi:MAG: hypothetical protein ACR2LR_13080 [Hassallia sp.]